ncbi:MAG: biopolymer transporter ExbD [Planctomycetes bacterium]|nr:biopolymer transporter ExbD [Planctomycetota bacterium]
MIVKRTHETPGPIVDLTPVIDMVFMLLIFFLVATTFQQAEREMKIALPHASAAGPISLSLREIVVNVDATGASSSTAATYPSIG